MPAMNSRLFKTAYELGDLIVEQAAALYGPWPAGMTLFVFDDAYGWTASISRPASEADNFYRTCTLDLDHVAQNQIRHGHTSPIWAR
jgi:hypothetical protein